MRLRSGLARIWLAPVPAALLACLAGALACAAPASAQVTSEPFFTSAGVGQMADTRFAAAAAPLPDGDVLIAGGLDASGVYLASTEIYDPSTRTFTAAANLPEVLAGAVAAPLPDGDVLIAGGQTSSGGEMGAELYDPSTGTFSATSGDMTTTRVEPVAAPLPDGDVLIAGGQNGSGGNLASAELYDPSTQTFSATSGDLATARVAAVAAPLPDGDVLIAGGYGSTAPLASAEIYDPSTQTFTATGDMTTARYVPMAAPLPDGDVLIAGGEDSTSTVVATSELYDPSTGTFRATSADMATARLGAVAAPLPDGEVLIAGGENRSSGGLSSAELFVPGAEAKITGGDLGQVIVGKASGEQALTVRNVGAQTLSVGGVALSGAQAADFTVVSDGCQGQSLAYGQSCTVMVQFSPSLQAAESATLTLQDNEPMPAAVTLIGTGVAQSQGVAGAGGRSGQSGPSGQSGAAGATGATGATGAPGKLIFAPCSKVGAAAIRGRALGRLRLGDTRAQALAAYTDSSNHGWANKTFFCSSSGTTRVGYASGKLLASLPASQRRAYRGRVVWISTADRHFSIRGVRPGMRLAAARTRLPGGDLIRVGLNDWYLAPDGAATAVLKVRHGTVQEIGIATRALTLTRAQQWRFMTSFN